MIAVEHLKQFVRSSAVAAAIFAGPALADSISPPNYTASVPVGGSTTVHKVVTVSAGAATTKADIVFLADTTGSMGGTISSVMTAANTILTATSGLGDIAWGVSEFKDNSDFGSPPPPSDGSYRLNTDITTTMADVTTGLGMWGASGGGDFPEQFLHALTKVSDTDSWRAGSEKIVVLFGDATAHDPGADGETLASTIADLVANGVTVIAFDVGAMDSAGQVTPIVTATGGSLIAGLGGDPAAAVIAAITSAVDTYSSVCLDLSGTPMGVTAMSSPMCINGSFDRSIDRTFDFDLTLTGDADGTYDWWTGALVDGGLVASEHDHLIVGTGTGGENVPEPMTLLVFGSSLLVGFGMRRRTKH